MSLPRSMQKYLFPTRTKTSLKTILTLCVSPYALAACITEEPYPAHLSDAATLQDTTITPTLDADLMQDTIIPSSDVNLEDAIPDTSVLDAQGSACEGIYGVPTIVSDPQTPSTQGELQTLESSGSFLLMFYKTVSSPSVLVFNQTGGASLASSTFPLGSVQVLGGKPTSSPYLFSFYTAPTLPGNTTAYSWHYRTYELPGLSEVGQEKTLSGAASFSDPFKSTLSAKSDKSGRILLSITSQTTGVSPKNYFIRLSPPSPISSSYQEERLYPKSDLDGHADYSRFESSSLGIYFHSNAGLLGTPLAAQTILGEPPLTFLPAGSSAYSLYTHILERNRCTEEIFSFNGSSLFYAPGFLPLPTCPTPALSAQTIFIPGANYIAGPAASISSSSDLDDVFVITEEAGPAYRLHAVKHTASGTQMQDAANIDLTQAFPFVPTYFKRSQKASLLVSDNGCYAYFTFADTVPPGPGGPGSSIFRTARVRIKP